MSHPISKIKQIAIAGADGKPITLDIFFNASHAAPAIIYAHGFNGFKDWGNFDLIAEAFAKAGFTFIKFNFSHNGTSPEHPEEFVDLQAYGNNNYTKELDDLQRVIDWTLDGENRYAPAIDPDELFLIGHSMGGGIVLVKAAEDRRIRRVATWAAVGKLTTPWGKWPAVKMGEWKSDGVAYTRNSRTGQDMPLYYQLYIDYQTNRKRLDVGDAVSRLSIPVLLCQGTKDEAVAVETAYELEKLNPRAELFVLETDHVFGRKHPWPYRELADATRKVVERTIAFFKSIT